MKNLSIDHLPLVSIIIPCRNERRFIGDCLDSVIANDYPEGRLEVLVINGVSEDGTQTVIEGYARQYPWIRLIENREKITPVALNIGIKNAKGEIILWMSAHNRYEKDYVSRSVESLEKYGADNVGGIMRTLPREDTYIGKAIVASLSHRFGVGNSYFRVMPKEPKWVDTVFGGCYRREVFDRVGLFNKNLVRGQDMEFNLRLKKAGGKTLLVPDIVSYYYARSDIKSFWKHNFANGVWAILPFLYSPIMPVSWRHLVPLIFVISLIGSAALGFVWTPLLFLFLIILCSYGLTNLGASLQIALEKRNVRYMLVMPFVFASLHFAYGLGSLWGLCKVLSSGSFWTRLFGLQKQNGMQKK
ncbi:MAG: glycosyltransferase family 2 protein [Deltaproteobacteria bacterium]|nr:glycosyltransferase family 2 protein [Deltaproteobacteria bacterium]